LVTTESSAPKTGDTILHRYATISTFNVENFSSNAVYLQQILNRSDIVSIQEHWLFTFEKQKLNTCFLKCCDEMEPISPKIRTRGFGGSGILCRKSLDPTGS
jgi:hypothetical protein